MTELVFYHQCVVPCPAFELLDATIKAHGMHRVESHFDEFRIDVYALSDSPSSRLVAIDYDNTITADPDFYQHLIQVFRENGWEPIVCTMRCPDAENLAEIWGQLRDSTVPIYTTDGQTKRPYMLERGIQIGLWLDDMFPAIACPGAWVLQVNGINY